MIFRQTNYPISPNYLEINSILILVKIMDQSLKLFLMGFAVSIIVTIIFDQSDTDGGFMEFFVTTSAQLWHLVFMLTVVTTIPFMVIEPLKKRFTRKTYLPFPFLGGYGTGFLLMASIGMIFSLVS